MSQVVSAGTGKRFGLARVCRVWEVARSTVYWQLHRLKADAPRRRPGPSGPCADDELVKKMRGVLSQSLFHGEGYRKVWAKLRFAGVRTSKRRVLRLMRENSLLAPHRAGRPHGPKAHDGTIITEQVDVVWPDKRLTLNHAVGYAGNKELGAKARPACTLSSAQFGH